ncbi:MAG: 50S ribosomal protein L6 [Pseudomonadaceae bacterium]|nr:50S ribosomal protein L6 [Pseudomonadaceae bacterium]
MSRIANAPVEVPSSVDIKLDGNALRVKGGKGEMAMDVHQSVEITLDDGALKFAPRDGGKSAHALSGTMRSLVANMVTGVEKGWEKRLQLQGVGYRAISKGKTLELQLGFSHPVEYPLPEGISIDTPSQTEVVVSGINKQLVGQVAAEIRSYRPPEPYKGKGVRYANEYVRRKEAKKK